MWIRWMMAAFLFNGLCTFGIRILAGLGLAERFTTSYLAFWYLAGTTFLLMAYLWNRLRPSRADLLLGAALGLCSWGGQTSIGLALAQGLPGNMVFPVVLAGGLFIVVAAGVLIFKEPVGTAGKLGIALGVTSIVLLSLS
jgi:multidrug transporter EmrE-like cation transporter